MGKGSISLVVVKRFLKIIFLSVFKPKELHLGLFYVLSVVPICLFFVALFYMLYNEGVFLLSILSLMFIPIFFLLVPIPETETEKKLTIDERVELVEIKLSYKCNPLLKAVYSSEVLLRFVWDRSSFYDIKEFAKVLGFIHVLYNHSVSAFWFAEYIILPLSLAFVVSEPSQATSLFILSLLTSVFTLTIKLNLKKGMEGKLGLVEKIVLRKPSMFNVSEGVVEIKSDMVKAIEFARKEGFISKSILLIRNILSSGGNT